MPARKIWHYFYWDGLSTPVPIGASCLITSEVEWIIMEAARNGGRDVDWEYWGKLPALTPIEAVCLVHCIDPDQWNNPPPLVDRKFAAPFSQDARDRVTKLLRIAEREIRSGVLPEQQSPWRWIGWAKFKDIEMNPEFYQAAYKAECDRITVHTVQPLEAMEDAAWPHWLSLDYWTVAEAVFLIHGFKPQSGDTTFNGLGDHFIQLNEPVNRAIEAGAIGKMRIERVGVRQYADTPRAWVAWARGKEWPICEYLRMWEVRQIGQDVERDHATTLARALMTWPPVDLPASLETVATTAATDSPPLPNNIVPRELKDVGGDHDPFLQAVAEEEAKKLISAKKKARKEDVAVKVAARAGREDWGQPYRNLSNARFEKLIRKTWRA